MTLQANTPERNVPYVFRDETIWKNSRMVGRVTSRGCARRLGQMIGLTTLQQAGGVTKDWIDAVGLSVRIAGPDFPLHAHIAPLYDPSGETMRG